MNQRYCKPIAATIASGASESSVIDVSAFKFFAVEFPTTTNLASATITAYIKGCDTSDGTFRQITLDDAANITSASTGNIIATVDRFVPPFVKIALSLNTATASAGYACRVHCFY